jgi:uncharacterized coiled-coil DUF342 family protein
MVEKLTEQGLDLMDANRTLKRERDEWAAMCGRYKQERDEAWEQVNHYRDKLDLLPIKWDI